MLMFFKLMKAQIRINYTNKENNKRKTKKSRDNKIKN